MPFHSAQIKTLPHFTFLIGNRLEANLRKLVRASFFQNEGVVIFKKHTEYVGGKFSTLPEKERI